MENWCNGPRGESDQPAPPQRLVKAEYSRFRRPDYKLPLNPVAVPNPIFIGLAALGVICLGISIYYFSAGDYVGWSLVVLGLFLFAAAAGVTLSLRTAGVIAAIAVVLLILSVATALPV